MRTPRLLRRRCPCLWTGQATRSRKRTTTDDHGRGQVEFRVRQSESLTLPVVGDVAIR